MIGKFFECEADKNGKYIDNPLASESVQILYNRLKEIKNNAN